MSDETKFKSDLKQIGLPTQFEEYLDELVEGDVVGFKDQQSAYRVAVAIAIGKELKIDQDTIAALSDCSTKWRAADGRSEEESEGQERGIDGRGSSVKDMVEIFCPEEAKIYGPYRYSQVLAMKGLRVLYSEMVDKGKDLSTVLEGLYPENEESN
jgi:hypothetical protein